MGFVRKLTGEGQAKAAEQSANLQAQSATEAIAAQKEAAERAQGFFQPFAGAAGRAVEGSNFLANPQAQFDSLQSNPLFQLGLDNANRVTQQSAASRGRLNAGDTATDLFSNALLVGQPLIDTQRQDFTNLLQFGGDIATSQANIETGQAARIGDLITGRGAVQAGGVVGSANAEQAGAQNAVSTALAVAGFFI